MALEPRRLGQGPCLCSGCGSWLPSTPHCLSPSQAGVQGWLQFWGLGYGISEVFLGQEQCRVGRRGDLDPSPALLQEEP